MRKIRPLSSLAPVARTGCKKDSTPSLVETPVLPPATEAFAPGASVTIQGKGFTPADEIWFRTQTKADDDIQAEVTNQTANELTFTVPQVSAGEHAVILKRNEREMVLGRLAVSETATATKLYAIGMPDNEKIYVLWEVDKATGELTEIVKFPTESEDEWLEGYPDESFGCPVVDPNNGNIYCLRVIDHDEKDEYSYDLYHIDPNAKTLKPVGLLTDQENTDYHLCIIDGQLHALIEKYRDEETFSSLVSINPETAEQTLVADFGSLHQALKPSSSTTYVGLYTFSEDSFFYDATTNSLICCSICVKDKNNENDYYPIVKLDIANKKTIAGEKTKGCFLFTKDGKICGAFYNKGLKHVDFRAIDTENLTVGESLGSAYMESDDKFFGETWIYDATTGKSYTILHSRYDTFGAFDFNTQKFSEIKAYTPGIYLYELFQ